MKIGLALGSGSSRGWSHIGVIKALEERGIRPDIVCGCSIGSLVGASYAFDKLDRLEEWVLSLSRIEVVRFLNFNRSMNGLIDKQRFHAFLDRYVANDGAAIESGRLTYASVATELETGTEVWLKEGRVLDAVWSSIALPGLFPAIKYQDRWLVDGGLVNPVPISLCRALGAEIVIAVNLNGALIHRRKIPEAPSAHPKVEETGLIGRIGSIVSEYTTSMMPETKMSEPTPNLFDALASSVDIMQDRITRSRMAGDPPDILLVPKLSQLGLMEFHRAREAIDEGYRSVQRLLPEIEYLLS